MCIHTHTHHCCFSDELSNKVFHASCPAVRLEINLKAGLVLDLISPFHAWKGQKHNQKL